MQGNNLYESVMEAYRRCAEGTAPSIPDVLSIYAGKAASDSVVSVLRLLTDLEVFERDPNNTVTFQQLFDRSVVLNLTGLSGAGQQVVDIVATMFIDNLYTDYMKRLPTEPFEKGPDGVSRRKVDSVILIDEAHHAMGRDFEVLERLWRGRMFGMGVILSSQCLSHFKTPKRDWGQPLSTWMVHNVRNASQKTSSGLGLGAISRP